MSNFSTKKQVHNLEVDLYEYNSFNTNINFIYTDIHVTTEYIDSYHYNIIITRLDQEKGWDESIKIMIHYIDEEITETKTVYPSTTKQQIILIETEFDIAKSSEDTEVYDNYSLPDKDSIPVDKMSKEDFEKTFQTEIYVKLPNNLYAVGFINNHIYIYNEKFGTYFNIIYSIQLLARVFFATYSTDKKYHFIICADDGFFESNYLSVERITPKIITEYEDGRRIILDNSKEYPVFYKNKWILAMSNHLDMPYTIDMIDRHYLYCNLYNYFRSFHRGIAFHQKKNKIVFACSPSRSIKYNFVYSRENDPKFGEISPRYYFYTEHVCKDNIECELDKWIDKNEMVNYKYILDIDGNACTWDATAWKLNSGSVIFKAKSPWKQWYYDEYLPWTHYVPIEDDFSDIQEKYKWCENHPLECEKMIMNCKQLFQKTFRFSNIITYVKTIFERTEENLS